jgi:nicotinamide mononucleotide (NMN) deamidase PncC
VEMRARAKSSCCGVGGASRGAAEEDMLGEVWIWWGEKKKTQTSPGQKLASSRRWRARLARLPMRRGGRR